MNIFSNWNKPQPTLKANLPSEPNGDMSITPRQQEGIFKTYIPGFLYKPPFGYPRSENLPLIRQTARNGYVYSIIKTICDSIECAPWEIVPKKDIELTDELRVKQKEITEFFSNPNGNKESFGSILRAVVKDILELDSGVIVKVFNPEGRLVQIFARDGGSFLKNPDIYGYMGNRVDIIEPASSREMQSFSEKEMMHYYELNYRDTAAYFQYGWTSASMPVPFGKNEVVYLMQNKRTDSIYGLSPVALLSDILYTLIYGSMYNLDFYNNNNMPEGFMSVLGASTTEIRATKERFESQFREKDKNTGFFRRVAYRLPWTNHEVKFTPFQLDPKTMQVIEQQQWFTKIVWACFGVTPDEMGFTDNSNRATTENQSALAKEKATKPILNLLAYHINQEIMPEFESNDFEFKFVDYNLDVEHKKYDLYLKQIQAGVMTPEMIAEEEGIDVAKVKAAQEEKKEMEMMAMAPKPSTDKKALLIKEVPDEIDEVYDFKVGDSVKVVSGTKAFEDKVGVVEKIVNNKTVIVRFDVGIDIFSSEQLVLIQEDEEGVSTIKAKDPFNNTAVEKKMLDDIHKSSKKIREALKLLK